ncbi:hypothetical protein [Iningainema tapete]|uniref:Uncharacterized protein n=1 Tax=Iningainema tapete BLCC-T55 TaxID=2748662 RepID=A0A8J7CFX6_9CYAN|nr:hypothetical protein [Iningainema tapete]MBD2775545.1 hypothetical protein [Iningainema tapete BLCC-T55]
MSIISINKATKKHKDEQEIIQFCLDKIISEQGYLIIIVGFSYGNHPDHNLFVRAEWLQKLVEEMLEIAQANIVYENSLQIGWEKKLGSKKFCQNRPN